MCYSIFRWVEANNVFNFATENWEQFASAVNRVPDGKWAPLYDFCNTNGDGEVSGDELTECAAAGASYVGMSEATQAFLYDFGVKYWSIVDRDGSGGLSFDEYKYTMGAFAAVDARVILKAFDSDGDNMVSGDELNEWKEFVVAQFDNLDWNLENYHDAIQTAWTEAQSKYIFTDIYINPISADGDNTSGSMFEIAGFIVNAWNLLLSSAQ